MSYQKTMPRLRDLKSLATQIQDFPITGLGIVQYAEHLGYDDEAIDFLKLFSGRRVFNSSADLVYHCSLLERLLREENSMPVEHLSSP